MAGNKVEASAEGVSSYLFDLLFAEAPKKPNFASASSLKEIGGLSLAFNDDNGVKRTFVVSVAEVLEGGKCTADVSKVQAQDAPGGCRPCNARKVQKSSQAEEGRGQETVAQEASEQPACEGG